MADRPVPQPPRNPAAWHSPAHSDRAKSFLKIKFSPYLNRRLDAETFEQKMEKSELVKWAVRELLDRLAARRKSLSEPWPWHYVTILGVVDGELAGVVADVRHPPACKSLPAWAHCWADHDIAIYGTWRPTDPGEYRLRLVPLAGEYRDGQDDEEPERVVQVQRQDLAGQWAPFG